VQLMSSLNFSYADILNMKVSKIKSYGLRALEIEKQKSKELQI